jgi:hypothetical protein
VASRRNPEWCQNGCGIYALKDCPGCGLTFLHWGYRGHDDVVVGPYATASGDLYCTHCGPRADREMEEGDREDAYYGPEGDDYPA